MCKFAQEMTKRYTCNKTIGEGNLFCDDEFYVRKKSEKQGEEARQAASDQSKYDFAPLFERLSKSDFRSRFHLRTTDREYIESKGLDTIRHHAEDFVRKRLASAIITNDGKQTPMRGHPVFLAQHATGCCCRGCLQRWHGISSGYQLTTDEQSYIVEVIMEWIRRQLG